MFHEMLTHDPEQIAQTIFDAVGKFNIVFPRRQLQSSAGIVIAPDRPLITSISWFGTSTRQKISDHQMRDAYCFTTCLQGAGTMAQRGNELTWRKNVTLPLQARGDLCVHTDEAFKARDVIFDRTTLHDFYERWSGRPVDRERMIFNVKPFDGFLSQRWEQAMHLLGPSGGGCDLPPLAKVTLIEYAMALLLECHPHDRPPALNRPAPSRIVREAVRYIENNARRSLSIGDVAQATGCSIRCLQLGFRSDLGTTPRTYLAKVRMTLAKNDLEQGDRIASVADVAYDLGFRHLGRFSAEFRSRFGEYPSEVLRKSRVRTSMSRARARA